MTRLYPETVNLAPLPLVGSVPAPVLIKYWLLDKPWLLVKYEMKTFKSPLKLEIVLPLAGKNEYTSLTPLLPLYNFQLYPANVTVATGVGFPEASYVAEIGPAPPYAASQTMISFSLEPVAEEEVKRS